MRPTSILIAALIAVSAAAYPAATQAESAVQSGPPIASQTDEMSSQNRRTRRAKRPVVRQQVLQQIACGRFGCGPIPRQCRIVGGRTFDGSPTGYDDVICP